MRVRYGVATPLQLKTTFRFLNTISINGWHRLSRSGRLNTGPGSYIDPKLLDEPLLRARSTALAGTLIVCHSVTKPPGRIAVCKSGKVLMFVAPPYYSE
jgi:site-specific DNA-adenine methylase